MKSIRNRKIELDLFRTVIPHKHCYYCHNLKPKEQATGVQIWRRFDGTLKIQCSGKIFADNNNFGAITLDNADFLTKAIYNKLNVEIESSFLLYGAEMYEVHVKTDIRMDEAPENYLSILREILKVQTDKYDVYRYDDTTYKNGLKVIGKPNCLSIVHKTKKKSRYIIYIKGKEIRQSDDIEYKKLFDTDFLQIADNTLRFEYQIKTFSEMREAFGIKESSSPTLFEILNSTRNPVYEKFKMLVAENGKESL